MSQLSKRQKEILAIAKESEKGELWFDRDMKTLPSDQQLRELYAMDQLVKAGLVYKGNSIFYGNIYPSKVTLVWHLTKKGKDFNHE